MQHILSLIVVFTRIILSISIRQEKHNLFFDFERKKVEEKKKINFIVIIVMI